MRKFLKRLRGRILFHGRRVEYLYRGRFRMPFDPTWDHSKIQSKLKSENRRYDYFLWFFQKEIPRELRDHRQYFEQIGNWCGEDAFHAFWFKLIAEYRPKNVLEIGVHRGQSISYFSLLARHLGYEASVWGLGPLTGDGDSVSSYGDPINYETDIHNSFRKLKLGKAQLFRGFSEDLSSVSFIKSQSWDLIYVDGSHDYEIVKSDVETARSSLSDNGLLVLDDASLESEYLPYSFSFAGHPDPSRVAKEICGNGSFLEIGTCGHLRVFKRNSAYCSKP